MDPVTRVQTLDEAICISRSANTFGEGMKSTYSPSSKGQIVGQTELLNLDMTTSLGEGKL